MGLPAGVAPWTREFLWLAQPRVGACGRCTGYFTSTAADERSTYGWKVRAVTRVWAGGAEGETLYIDANSGRVLDRARWSIVQ